MCHYQPVRNVGKPDTGLIGRIHLSHNEPPKTCVILTPLPLEQFITALEILLGLKSERHPVTVAIRFSSHWTIVTMTLGELLTHAELKVS